MRMRATLQVPKDKPRVPPRSSHEGKDGRPAHQILDISLENEGLSQLKGKFSAHYRSGPTAMVKKDLYC